MVAFANNLNPDHETFDIITCIPERTFVTVYKISRHQKTHHQPGADPGLLVRGVHMCRGEGVRFADFISIFLDIP